MPTTLQFSTTPAVTLSGESFSFSVAETPLNVSGSVVDVSNYDAVNTITTGTGIFNNCKINVAVALAGPGYSLSNLTPAIASADASGNVALLQAGTAEIDIITPYTRARFTRVMSSTGTTAREFKNYKTASLGLHIKNAIDTMIANKTPGQTTQKLTTANNNVWNGLTATRNSQLFTGALDLTAISLARSDAFGNTYGEILPPTLISSRHVLTNKHTLSPGLGVAWLDSTGTARSATVLSMQFLDSIDMAVGYLSAAITGITPMKTLPANWNLYIKSLSGANNVFQKLPCLVKSYWPTSPTGSVAYTSGITIVEADAMFDSTNGFITTPSRSTQVASAYAPWTSGVIGIRAGDSASPLMVPINGVATLLGSYYGADVCPAFPTSVDWITAAMRTLATESSDPLAATYAMGTADLSGFTQFTVQ